MASHSDVPTHHEIEETVEQNEQEMSEKLEELEVLTEDVETTRDLEDALDLDTTVEGAEEIEMLVESAETETVDIFEQEDNQLEGIQQDAQDYVDEIDDRHETAESDLEKISGASCELRTAEPINRMTDAKSSMLTEMDFLRENNQKAEDAKTDNMQAQQSLEARINSGKGV